MKEKIYLGNTPYDIDSVNEIFKLYIPYWLGKTYNLFQKNCNDFTNFFACLLLRTDKVINYPEYVNRITIFAQYFSMFYNPIKKMYLDANSSPSITSSLNSEFLSNENRDNNIEENNNNNNEEINNNEEMNNNNEEINNNIEINNDRSNNLESKENFKENKEEKSNNVIKKKKKEIKIEKENNGG